MPFIKRPAPMNRRQRTQMLIIAGSNCFVVSRREAMANNYWFMSNPLGVEASLILSMECNLDCIRISLSISRIIKYYQHGRCIRVSVKVRGELRSTLVDMVALTLSHIIRVSRRDCYPGLIH
ncbi:hypothetical protein [Algisphaera agarilytica]|uniref:Uncharacterized protein n=1 Tax=Algisphaera agarilytica TaxID=1385975 RepID=A0A7X0H8S3_9BACT|nr:hypothetical protein [Algisphaera agarilytica]MBB6429910.1 hypothetical protein [Algisphaera agarilytica]